MRLRFSIRLQLLLLSLFLFAIPWLGYRYIWELESYLRLGQEQTMIGTARAVATALHERPALFDSQAAYLTSVRPGTDLYAAPIAEPIQLDGKVNDWNHVSPLIQDYGSDHVVTWFDDFTTRPPITLSFKHMVGQFGDYLYAMFIVEDDSVIWRESNALSVDQSDHLLISLLSEDGTLQRFIISPYTSGWVNAYTLGPTPHAYKAIGNELRIQGRWRETEKGYNIELRFPKDMTQGALAFAFVDIDSFPARTKRYAVGTANPNITEELGTVLTPSPEIEQVLASLRYAGSRVWVVDRHMRVLAKAGDIHAASGLDARVASQTKTDNWWNKFESEYILPLYYQILTKPPPEFIDELQNAYALAGTEISHALDGTPDSLWRLTPDNKAVILSAAYPIFIEGNVMGAVVVEQTTNGIRTLRNRALEQLFHVILAVMILGTLSLLLFANRISTRIRKLRDATEAVIDDNGKIVSTMSIDRRGDEIGDLSRSFSSVLTRLQQYNSYLENMASRLSHELRTPIAIVKSSLDTLSHVDDANQQAQFVERAQSGIARLSNILNSMSEATRLEHAITQEETEVYNLNRVVAGCVEGYKHAYDSRDFQLKQSCESAKILGSPELFAQMMDKIVANAVEFSQSHDMIKLHIWQDNKQVKLSITNPGPCLPEGMKDELLNSMVSVRPDTAEQHKQHPHLGLGLFISNMITAFHKGKLTLENLPDQSGVCAIVSIPIYQGDK